MHIFFKDRTGKRFGTFIVVRLERSENDRTYWICQCDCGKQKIVRGDTLNNQQSCGCKRARHGHCRNDTETGTYESWRSMMKRCYDPNNASYHRYGKIGICVCRRWRRFENFLTDMGERPAEKSLDRYPDNTGNYSRNNCRWATAGEQALNRTNNRLITFEGETLPLIQWSRRFGVGGTVISERISRGWPLDVALRTPARAYRL